MLVPYVIGNDCGCLGSQGTPACASDPQLRLLAFDFVRDEWLCVTLRATTAVDLVHGIRLGAGS